MHTIDEKLKRELAERSDKIEKGINKFSDAEDLNVLLQYSKGNFALVKESTEYVEKKADELIKYLVAAVGFLIALLSFLIKSFPSHHLPFAGWVIMGLDTILWFAAIILGLMARRPEAYLYPSQMDGLLEILETKMSENNSNALRIEMILNYESAAESHSYLGRGKAGKLKCSYYVSVLALFLFLVAVVFFSLSSSAAHREPWFLFYCLGV